MFATLKEQFEETKKTLKDVEENIRRITGRDPDQFAVTAGGNITFKNDGKFAGKPNAFQRKRPFQNRFGNQTQAGPVEAEEGEEEEKVEEEESPDEEGGSIKKPTLQSTIVATRRDIKSRKDTLEEQKSDSRCFARNRRMFGFVLGTLQKFQTEESSRRIQAEKREKIDKRLEEAAEKEKELMKKEKDQMFIARREKQMQIRCLEKKMEIAELHEVWEASHKLLGSFIQTEATPSVMYLPAKHNAKTQKALKDSQEKNLALITDRRTKIEQELNELDKWYSKDDYDEADDVGEKENMVYGEVTPENGLSQDHVMSVEEPGGEEQNSIEANTEEPTTDKTDENETDDQKDFSLTELVNQEDFEPIYDE